MSPVDVLRRTLGRSPWLRTRLGAARRQVAPAVQRARAHRADWVDVGWRASVGRPAARRAVTARLQAVARALDLPAEPFASSTDVDELARCLAPAITTDAHRWLLLAVLDARLPTVDDVVLLRRRSVTRGNQEAVAQVVAAAGRRAARPGPAAPEVTVLVGETLVDVEHTSRTELATGIQRVARLTTQRWAADRDVLTVGWTSSERSLRLLSPHEHARAIGVPDEAARRDTGDGVVVPWRSSYLLPELVTEEPRYQRLAAMARFSGNRTAAIGFDCVPVSTAETTAEAMGSAFAGQLAALRDFDVVAPISHAAGAEFSGWAAMCRAAGRSAPDVRVVPLAAEASSCSEETLRSVQQRMTYGGSLPMVLVVGSHEPRKNHRAVLHAAERLWREGCRFSMLFVGGNAWHSERFAADLSQLQSLGRLVDSVRGLSDDELWALYRLAWCTAFPSLNEGFGLPVAESLAAGTPVLTSGYGSMKEIAASGGAMLVDPRDDDSITDGLRALLCDRPVYRALKEAAAGFPVRTWQVYADELFAAMTGPREAGPA